MVTSMLPDALNGHLGMITVPRHCQLQNSQYKTVKEDKKDLKIETYQVSRKSNLPSSLDN